MSRYEELGKAIEASVRRLSEGKRVAKAFSGVWILAWLPHFAKISGKDRTAYFLFLTPVLLVFLTSS